MAKIFIDGREGTTGLRIVERLSGREDIVLLKIDEALRKDPTARKAMIDEADVVFLCLPDAAAKEAVSLCGNPNTRIIDASTAHRTEPGWAYGFPELSPEHRRTIAASKRICVPGCHASGFLALVYPLIAASVIGPDYPIVCHSVTGYTGGGKSMIAQYENAERDDEFDSPRQYALTQAHKHLKEMQRIAALAEPPIFTPIVADFPTGMVVTVPLHARLLKNKISLGDMHNLYIRQYENQPLIRVLPPDPNLGFLAANRLSGKDSMEIFVAGNDERILLTARFDNLGKGASGAAVQLLNIALGRNETAGLSL